MESSGLFANKKTEESKNSVIFKSSIDVFKLLRNQAEENAFDHQLAFAWLIQEGEKKGLLSVKFRNMANLVDGKAMDSIDFVHTTEGWQMNQPIKEAPIEELTTENIADHTPDFVGNIEDILKNLFAEIKNLKDYIYELENKTELDTHQKKELQHLRFLKSVVLQPVEKNCFAKQYQIQPLPHQAITLYKKETLHDLLSILYAPATTKLLNDPCMLIKKKVGDNDLKVGMTYDRSFLEAKGYRCTKENNKYIGDFIPDRTLKQIIDAINEERLDKIKDIITDATSLDPMIDSVLTATGNSFSRSSLDEALKISKKLQDPTNRTPLKTDEIFSNQILDHFIKLYTRLQNQLVITNSTRHNPAK